MDEKGLRTAKQLFVVQAVANAATIAGVLLAFLSAKWWILALVALVTTLIVQYRLYRVSTRQTFHEFRDEREEGFVKFFSDWYDRNGRHDIYCKDLDWLDRPEVRPIVDVLIRRSSQVSIFIRENYALVCQELTLAGVRIYTIPDHAKSEMKMSLRSDNDDKELIIRRKAPGTETVRFIQSEDQYLLGLAEDLFAGYRADHPYIEPSG